MKDNKEIQICDKCRSLIDEYSQTDPRYAQHFEELSQMQDCANKYLCMPMVRIRAKQDELRKTA